MRLTFSVVLIIVLAASCRKSPRPEKPENLISKDKMGLVLYDLFVINSAKGVNRKLLEVKGVIPEDYVLKRHNIDSLQFAASNDYYAYDIDEYSNIIEKVKARIEKEKAGFQAILDSEDSIKRKRRDSIKEARKANPNKLKKLEKFEKDKETSKKSFKLDSTVGA